MSKNLILNRNAGIEMEGYFRFNPRMASIDNAEKKTDASLQNCDWTVPKEWYGIELAFHPTKNIEGILEAFDKMVNRYGWHTNADPYGKAGTHIHIEIDDFTFYDRMKMLMFTHYIQDFMFLFVKDYRYGNTFCRFIEQPWGSVFNKDFNWNLESSSLIEFITEHGYWSKDFNDGKLYFEKYTWANVQTRFPTIEFRCFQAINERDEIINFMNMANNLVETVKNSTVEQLRFIASELWIADSIEKAGEMFLESIGMSHDEVPMVGNTAKLELYKKFETGRIQIAV